MATLFTLTTILLLQTSTFDPKLVLFFAFVVIVLTKNPLVRRLNLEFWHFLWPEQQRLSQGSGSPSWYSFTIPPTNLLLDWGHGFEVVVLTSITVYFSPPRICAAVEGNLTKDQLAWRGNNRLNRPCAPSLLLCLWMWVTHDSIYGRRFLFWGSLGVFYINT